MKVFSERVDIRVGYRCNARCGFCYYMPLVNNPTNKEPSTALLAKRLHIIRLYGATEIEFTGGEATIRNDLHDLAAIAKGLGFKNISLISNGIRLSNPRYTEKLVKAGINDFLLSIHGHTPEIHDAHTKVQGSFCRIMQAAGNVLSVGARCRSSSTITGLNYQYLSELLEMLIKKGFESIHFPVFSPVSKAPKLNTEVFVRYSDASRAIIKAIKKFERELPRLSVKYIPFCFMQGYEKYVMNGYQQSFDPDEWNYYLSQKVRHGENRLYRMFVEAAVLAGSMVLGNREGTRLYGWKGLQIFSLVRLLDLLRRGRPAVCRKCRYDFVCDHVYKGYLRRYGESEFLPVSGSKITDAAWCYAMAGYRQPGEMLSNGAKSSNPKHNLLG